EIAADRDVGAGGTETLDQPQIAVGGMAAVHSLEHSVAATLHRQVEERHQLLDLAVRSNQSLSDVMGIAGGVPASPDLRELGNLSDQVVEGEGLSPVVAGPGVDVLAEQGDLACTVLDQFLGFLQQIIERPRNFGAAGVGNDAIGAELVAAFLDREKGA